MWPKKADLKEDCRHGYTPEENNFCRVTPEADLSDENGNTYCKTTGHLNIPVSGQTCNANMHMIFLQYCSHPILHVAFLVKGNERFPALDAESFCCSHY